MPCCIQLDEGGREAGREAQSRKELGEGYREAAERLMREVWIGSGGCIGASVRSEAPAALFC